MFLNPRNKGSGLIETLVALIFISLGIASLIRFQRNLEYNSQLIQQQNDATTIGMDRMETLRSFVILPTTAGLNAYADIATGNTNTVLNNTTYTIAQTVTTNVSPAYKTVDLTVSWTDRFNVNKSIRLVSRIAGIDPAYTAEVK